MDKNHKPFNMQNKLIFIPGNILSIQVKQKIFLVVKINVLFKYLIIFNKIELIILDMIKMFKYL